MVDSGNLSLPGATHGCSSHSLDNKIYYLFVAAPANLKAYLQKKSDFIQSRVKFIDTINFRISYMLQQCSIRAACISYF